MKHSEIKQSCALISLVANAVATDTIEEALEYLTERYDTNDDIVCHAYLVLNQIKNNK